MRMALITAILASGLAAAPAVGQGLSSASVQAQIEFQAQMDRQRAVALQNDLNTLETRVAAEQRIAALRDQRSAVRLATPAQPLPAPTPSVAPVRLDPAYASIPDDLLAQSNARVRAASANRK